jgi:hypothetical protein
VIEAERTRSLLCFMYHQEVLVCHQTTHLAGTTTYFKYSWYPSWAEMVCSHARPVEVNLGVPMFGTLFHLFLYKHDFIGTKSNMELLGDEPLQNFDIWIK